MGARLSRLLSVGLMALSAASASTIARGYTITYDVQQKFYNNLGGDTGFFYDAVTLFQRTSTANIMDGQTIIAPDFQTIRFDVGDTGSFTSRVEAFDASRDITIEGIVGTIHQSGQVHTRAQLDCISPSICRRFDRLSFEQSDTGFWNLAFGEDRKRLDVSFNSFDALAGIGTSDLPMQATFFLFNEPDNPIALLASTTVTSGQAALLNASASDDRDDFGTLVRFDWDLNSDGTYDRSTVDPTLAMTPAEYEQFWSHPGTYTVRLRVIDNDGLSDATAQSLTLLPGPPPAPAATVPEPATLATFASTALLLAVWYWPRRRSDDHAAACRTSMCFGLKGARRVLRRSYSPGETAGHAGIVSFRNTNKGRKSVLRTSLTILAFSMSLLPTVTIAGPKEDGRALVEKWAETVNRGKADEVAALFRPDAVVWGITTTSLATSPDDVKGYFSNALSRPLTVKLQNHTTSALSDGVVVDAGVMELSRPAEGGGQPTVIPVRYHFVVVKDGAAWKIAALHASRRP